MLNCQIIKVKKWRVLNFHQLFYGALRLRRGLHPVFLLSFFNEQIDHINNNDDYY